MSSTSAMFTANGVCARSGEYLFQSEQDSLVQRIKEMDAMNADQNRVAEIGMIRSEPNAAPPYGADPNNLARMGWGVVIRADEDTDVVKHIARLLTHREEQAGAQLTKCLLYKDESWYDWLRQYGVNPGNVIPNRIPYYLLIVGGPDKIPFEFQHLLALDYAVGRLDFEDTNQYGAYIDSIIAYEREALLRSNRELAFWSTRHAFDSATILSSDYLVDPLELGIKASNHYPAIPSICEGTGFRSRRIRDANATKERLTELICPGNNGSPPAILFTASHGLGWTSGDPEQEKNQGALVTHGWSRFQPLKTDHYFGPDDIPSEADLTGMIAFHFACYSAGTPQRDRFTTTDGVEPAVIANKAFVSGLAKGFLSQKKGPALAVIGHVERAWGYSIASEIEGGGLAPFQFTLLALQHGARVGHAISAFGDMYAGATAQLAVLLQRVRHGFTDVDNLELIRAWAVRNDAEAYALLGDPAVRLNI